MLELKEILNYNIFIILVKWNKKIQIELDIWIKNRQNLDSVIKFTFYLCNVMLFAIFFVFFISLRYCSFTGLQFQNHLICKNVVNSRESADCILLFVNFTTEEWKLQRLKQLSRTTFLRFGSLDKNLCWNFCFWMWKLAKLLKNIE